MPKLIAVQAQQVPNKTAAIFNGESLSYQELDNQSDRLAALLLENPQQLVNGVAICVERSVQMLVGLLGILKSGSYYIPLDPNYPAKRLRQMLDDSATQLIISQSGIAADLANTNIPRLNLDELNLVEDLQQPVALPAVSANSLMYTIFTSGSTGKPKGVQVTHANVTNFLLSMQQVPGLGSEDKLLAVTTLSFDIAVLELFLPLISGATVEIAENSLLTDGPRLVKRLQSGDITVMQATPATWRMLLLSGWQQHNSQLKALIGGEALTRDLLPGLLDNVAELWNMYGPTETTVWSTCHRMTAADAPILIGSPIANTAIHILDESGTPVAEGQPGELYIGGMGVSKGYLHQQQLTDEKFVPDPFTDQPDARLYRTGDLVKVHADGGLEYLNRLDNQVKLRGFRIELGDIEAAVGAHEQVNECVVILHEDTKGDSQLVAYYTTPTGDELSVSELRAFVQVQLPEFMTPAAWVWMSAIPLTPNGKTDRKALPAPERDRPDLAQAFVAPRGALEIYLADIWRDMLDLDAVGSHDRFFELGGNSIKAIQFLELISKRLEQEVSVPGFFAVPTIADFAEQLQRQFADQIQQKLLGEANGNGSAAPLRRSSNEKKYSERGRRPNAAHTGDTEIAIIGMACRLPGAADVDAFWRNLCGGVESRYEVTVEDLLAAGIDPGVLDEPDYVNACMPLEDVDKFDAAFFGINPREAELMDPQQRIFLECAWTALEDAAYAPDQTTEPVGVFGGVARNAYQLHNIAAYNDKRNAGGDYHILLGNDKDFLATRVAYKLNLTGPAMTVQSACSASGTALHQARLSLLAGDCDMALVGGGRIMSPHKVGYHYVDGNVLSADGRVHAFDADASGMIRGSGMVMIVLKRLNDALADNDNIRAVIKSSASNNDGGAKASFTAPSVKGQAATVRRAMQDAAVTPDSISYVEAHGTGTRLGDPIEVAALTEAWQDRAKGNQYCAIGSSKTNIGHLDAGACVTGVIKTALSLQQRQIPASLNFKQPNPLIDFANSPFYVNTELADWVTDNGPRRAAVSSFGVGGTNAHVIMEEAPPRAVSSASRARQLLLLSGKRDEAVTEGAQKLAAHLRANPDISLGDVAYTLQIGRSYLPLRYSLVCEDRDDAIAKLDALAAKVVQLKPAEENRPCVFMFPGQGSQHLDMALELHEREPVFRVHFDHCCRELKPLMGMDLRDIMFPAADADRDTAAQTLQRTEVTQPALFAIEYSLAKLLNSWGVNPDVMMGHSVGEYVAACLADVIELHDALRILVMRGRLMGSMPAGDMLAVPIPTAQLDEYLIDGVSLAASNAPQMSVVAGTHAAIDTFRQKLEAQDLQTFPLHTSHAFHSAMMEPILQPFMQAFDDIELKAPSTPFISSLTGDWISDEQACAPAYWAQQLRQAVLFSKGVETILADQNPIFIEVGPGNALSNAIRQHASPERRLTVVSSQSTAQKPEPALQSMLECLGQLWVAGITPDWDSFYASEVRHRLALPAYAFAKTRHWLEPPPAWNDATALAGQIVSLDDTQTDDDSSTSDAVVYDHAAAITQRLKRTLYAVTGIEISAHDEHSSFLELGFDSLLITQVSAGIRKEFGIALKFKELAEDYSSVYDLAAHLADYLPEEVTVAAPAAVADGGATRLEKAQLPHDTAPNLTAGVPAAEQSLQQLVLAQTKKIDQLLAILNDNGLIEPSSKAIDGGLVSAANDTAEQAACQLGVLPMTPPQLELWMAGELLPEGACAFNLSISIIFDGSVDHSALQAALLKLIDRHQGLRFTYDGEQHVVNIAESLAMEIPLLDLSADSAESIERRIAQLKLHEVETPFDLQSGPGLRATLVKMARAHYELLFTVHHLIADGWSIDLMADELAELYSSIVDARASTLPTAFKFTNYAAWLAQRYQAADYAATETFWLQQLAPPPAALELPADRPRTRGTSCAAARLDHALDPAQARQLLAASAQLKTTFYVLAYAGFISFLHRLTGQSDIVVGVPAAGQSVLGENRLVGHCVNTLPVRTTLAAEQTFADLLAQVKDQMYAAQEHKLLTYSSLLPKIELQRDPARLPLIAVMFNVDQENHKLDFSGLAAHYKLNARSNEYFELHISIVAFNDAVEIQCQYRTDLFDESTIASWMKQYVRHLLSAIENPHTRLLGLDIIPHDQLASLQAWNATQRNFASPHGFLQLIDQQAQRVPAKVAIVDSKQALSYAELDIRSNQIANYLSGAGVAKGDYVAICVQRSAQMLVTLLGILKTGAAYVPLDPGYPSERLRFMLETAEIKLLLTETSLAATIPSHSGVTLCMDEIEDEIRAAATSKPATEISGDDLAYVIFTSGSTGKPKGVQVQHSAVANFLQSMAEKPGLNEHCTLLALTTLAFDIAVLELYLPLTVGATTVVADTDDSSDGHRLQALLEQHKVDVMQATPSTWRLLLATGWRGGKDFTLLCGGEALPGDLQQPLLESAGSVWNMYGPTETTVWSTCCKLGLEDSISIGQPIANTQCYVLDSAGQQVAIGVAGELFIGGAGVSKGYLQRPDLTAERFISDPFSAASDARLYRTGDLVRWRLDGQLEYISRIDTQVKVRGFRIEPGEIEAVLAQHAAVKQSVVVVSEHRPGDQRLVAYVVLEDDQPLGVTAMRKHMRTQLPDYMVPQHLVELGEIPKTSNGKIDSNSLPPPFMTHSVGAVQKSLPANQAEQWIAELWEKLLGVEIVNTKENFFDLGGHSLLAAEFISIARQERAVKIPLAAVAIQSLAQIAESYADVRVDTADEGAIIPARESRSETSFLQRFKSKLFG